MKKVILALALLFVLPALGSGQAAIQSAAIKWEVVNPFPFFTNLAVIDELRKIYDGLPEKSAKKLERALQDAADAKTYEVRAKARREGKCDPPITDPVKRKECFAQYLGWFAQFVSNKVEDRFPDTCWDFKEKKYRKTGKCAGYINPGKTTRVRAWIDDGESEPVQWSREGATLETTECDGKYRRKNCVEFDMDYTGNDERSVTWQISAARNGDVIASVLVSINNRLIVGLGDSYASGEGSPDRPASFTEGRTDVDFLYTLSVRRNPQKDKDGDAVWLDRRCHRSMYSYQFKTALQYALEYPREVVTFVSFSCSGAVTDDIIKNDQKPKEGKPRLEPQLKALKEALADGKNGLRKIDYLLLSTGGNDIKFAKYVSYIVNTGLIKFFYAKKPKKDKTAEFVKKTLLGGDGKKGNYFRLQEAFFGSDSPVLIKGCDKNKPCSGRILLTAYPSPFNYGPNDVCRADRREFDIPFKKDQGRKGRIIKIKDWMFAPLREAQEDKALNEQLGWTVVKDHFADYLAHGFCAQSTGEGGSGNAEIFVMPKRKDKLWETFNPWDYRVYESRQRWFKLPVDAKLSTDQSTYFRTFSINLDLAFEDDIASIMHPTAEGLARTADANMLEINKLRP